MQLYMYVHSLLCKLRDKVISPVIPVCNWSSLRPHSSRACKLLCIFLQGTCTCTCVCTLCSQSIYTFSDCSQYILVNTKYRKVQHNSVFHNLLIDSKLKINHDTYTYMYVQWALLCELRDKIISPVISVCILELSQATHFMSKHIPCVLSRGVQLDGADKAYEPYISGATYIATLYIHVNQEIFNSLI